MKKTTKVFSSVLIVVLSLSLLTACGGSSSSDDKTIKVAATPAPHAEILYEISDALAEQGWKLDVIEYQDYILPNEAVLNGECDANYFQHQPYLDQYNEENDTDLVSAGIIHYEPLGIYKGTKNSIESLKKGDKIGIPSDVTNEGRALQLLASKGMIALKEGVGLSAKKEDIISNPKGLKIVELEAALLPAELPDLALAVINGNYALGGGLTSKDAIIFESKDSEAATAFANIICCAKENKDSAKIKALVAALQTEQVKTFVKNKYNGSVQTMF